MPLADFRCKRCGKTHELIVSIHAGEPSGPPAPTLCDPGDGGCGADGDEGLERVKEIGRTGFTLKGRGWAAHGYS